MNNRRQERPRRRARALGERAAAAALLLAAAASLALPGCGGGLAAGGGIGGSGFVAGPIEEVGSITVDGIRFDLGAATVLGNGEPLDASELEVGMFVGVRGDIDEDAGTGVASRVDYEETVRGLVTFVSATGRRLRVLGQLVVLRNSTRLVGFSNGQVPVGAFVTVSGERDDEGIVFATRVAREQLDDGCRILGEVAGLSTDRLTFSIGDLVVDATAAFIVGGELAEGDQVGVLAEQCEGDGPLLAVEVRRLDVLRPSLEGTIRRVRGILVELLSGNRFVLRVPTVGRVRVQLVRRTEFEGGTAEDLRIGDVLRVRGLVDSGGTLTAGRVVFLGED